MLYIEKDKLEFQERVNKMIEVIKRKIDEIKESKRSYLTMLEKGNTLFEDEYILNRIKECRIEIDVLEEVLDEYEKEI